MRRGWRAGSRTVSTPGQLRLGFLVVSRHGMSPALGFALPYMIFRYNHGRLTSIR